MPNPTMQPTPVAQGVQQAIAQPAGPAPAPVEGAAAAEGQGVEYAQLFDNISKIIDGEPGLEKIQDSIMNMLATGSQNPAEALAQATLGVGEMVFKSAQESGVQLTDEDLVAAAMDTLTSLDELASEAGIFEATDEDLQEAFSLTLNGWMAAHPEMIDQEGMRQSLAEMDPGMVTEAQDMFGGVQQPEAGPQPEGPMPAPQGGLINA